LRIGLLDHDDRLAFHNLRFHFLLLSGFQVACVLRLRAHTLNGIHDVGLLRQKRIAQIGGPLQILGELLQRVGQRGHCLNAGVPVLLLDGLNKRLVLQVLVLLQPLLELNDFQGIGGGGKDLRQKRVGV
jgi:hypothetical protein